MRELEVTNIQNEKVMKKKEKNTVREEKTRENRQNPQNEKE